MPFDYIRTENGFKCPHCDYERSLQSTVHMHIRAKHTGAFKQKCPHCPYETVTKASLDNHIAAKHVEESQKPSVKDKECPCCIYVCRTEAQLRSHYVLKHLTAEFEALLCKKDDCFSCAECKGVFKSRAAFVYHIVECLPEERKLYAEDRIGLCLD